MQLWDKVSIVRLRGKRQLIISCESAWFVFSYYFYWDCALPSRILHTSIQHLALRDVLIPSNSVHTFCCWTPGGHYSRAFWMRLWAKISFESLCLLLASKGLFAFQRDTKFDSSQAFAQLRPAMASFCSGHRKCRLPWSSSWFPPGSITPPSHL